MPVRYCCALALAIACISRLASGEDWPRFRGPDGSGVSSATRLPLTWSDTENVAWKTEAKGYVNSFSTPSLVDMPGAINQTAASQQTFNSVGARAGMAKCDRHWSVAATWAATQTKSV